MIIARKYIQSVCRSDLLHGSVSVRQELTLLLLSSRVWLNKICSFFTSQTTRGAALLRTMRYALLFPRERYSCPFSGGGPRVGNCWPASHVMRGVSGVVWREPEVVGEGEVYVYNGCIVM